MFVLSSMMTGMTPARPSRYTCIVLFNEQRAEVFAQTGYHPRRKKAPTVCVNVYYRWNHISGSHAAKHVAALLNGTHAGGKKAYTRQEQQIISHIECDCGRLVGRMAKSVKVRGPL